MRPLAPVDMFPKLSLPDHLSPNAKLGAPNTDKFMKSRSVFLKENIFAYVMPQNVSIDIDTETDFMFAKIILEHYDE